MPENNNATITNSSLHNSNVAGRDNINNNYYYQCTPQLFVETVLIIAKNLVQSKSEKKAPDIQEKIQFNNLFVKEKKINEYVSYFPSIKKAQNILALDSPISFENAIAVFRDKYLSAIEKYNKKISSIQNNSETIWEEIKKNIVDENNIKDSYIIFSLEILMCYAFTKCKIFEEPV